MTRVDPRERLDIYQVLNHPAIAPFQTTSHLSADEYQIMLRNYLLNTQGVTNRNLPEEIEKFMNNYNEVPTRAHDSVSTYGITVKTLDDNKDKNHAIAFTDLSQSNLINWILRYKLLRSPIQN